MVGIHAHGEVVAVFMQKCRQRHRPLRIMMLEYGMQAHYRQPLVRECMSHTLHLGQRLHGAGRAQHLERMQQHHLPRRSASARGSLLNQRDTCHVGAMGDVAITISGQGCLQQSTRRRDQ